MNRSIRCCLVIAAALMIAAVFGPTVQNARAAEMDSSKSPIQPGAVFGGSPTAMAALGEDRLVVGLGHRVVLYDVSNAQQPQIRASTGSLCGAVLEILVDARGFAYVLTAAQELIIVDLQDTSGFLSDVRQDLGPGWSIDGAIALAGERLALLDASSQLWVFDVIRPLEPVLLAAQDLSGNDGTNMLPDALALSEGRAYVTTKHRAEISKPYNVLLTVLELSDPTAPILLVEHWLGETSSIWRTWMTVRGDQLFENVSSPLSVHDMSNPITPRSSTDLLGRGYGQLARDGDTLWAFRQTELGGSLIKLDLANLGKQGATYPIRIDAGWGMTVAGDRIYMQEKWHKVRAIEVEQDRVGPRGVIASDALTSLALAGRAMYMTSSHNSSVPETQVWDVSDPYQVRVMSSMPFAFWGLELYDDVAYGVNPEGLHVLDATDPLDLRPIARLDLPTEGYRLLHVNDYVLVSTRDQKSVFLIDVRVPLRPTVVESIVASPEDKIVAIAVDSRRLALIRHRDSRRSVDLYDRSDPAQLALTASIDVPRGTLAVELFEDKLLTGDQTGLYVFDLSDVFAPVALGHVSINDEGSYITRIVHHWGKIYVLKTTGFWEVVPSGAEDPGSWRVSRYPVEGVSEDNALFVTHDRIYVARQHAGMYVFERQAQRLFLPNLSRRATLGVVDGG